jgi:calcineurin-like phosphoesterase family protein
VPNIFLTADTHFHHKNICKLGARPFASVDEMNQTMVDRWNQTVNPTDRVYHLGDVAMWKPETLDICRNLNGQKYLIRGNHDNYSTDVYKRYGFVDVVGYKEFKDWQGNTFVCTHCPLHPMDIAPYGRWSANVHGHIHQLRVQTATFDLGFGWFEQTDPRYFCVSVEQTDYRPVSLEWVKQKLREQQVGD